MIIVRMHDREFHFAEYVTVYMYVCRSICASECVVQYIFLWWCFYLICTRSLQGGEKKKFSLFGNRKKKDERKEGKKSK